MIKKLSLPPFFAWGKAGIPEEALMRRWWLLGVLALCACHPLPFREEVFPRVAQAAPKKLPRSMKLYVFRDYPMLNLPYEQVVEGGVSKRIDLPNLVYLVDHPAGLTLIDSGYGRRFPERKANFPLNVFYSLFKVGMASPYRLVSEQMRAAGLSPERVNRLLMTHLHSDHAGGIPDFPSAEIVVNRKEWQAKKSDSSLSGDLRQSIVSRLKEVDLSGGKAYETFEHSLDLYGDGAIVLVETPGHTGGHMSVFVNLPSGKRFFLAGDVAWVRENYAQPARKSWIWRTILEPQWQDEALLRVHQLSKLAPDVIIVPNHDPESDQTLLKPPACYE